MHMLITTGKVQDGTIHLEGASLPEGAIVTVLTHEGDETFELGPEEEPNSSRQLRKPRATSWLLLPSFFSKFGLNERTASGSYLYFN
jgi:hypothetical protein